jgi:hypothetical protein
MKAPLVAYGGSKLSKKSNLKIKNFSMSRLPKMASDPNPVAWNFRGLIRKSHRENGRGILWVS